MPVNRLSQVLAFVDRTSASAPGAPASNLAQAGLTRPIDLGAEALLRPFINGYLEYPPLQVEYLIRTLNEHLASCLEIRQRGQDLEDRAFLDAADYVLQSKLLKSLETQWEQFKTREPNLLTNQVELTTTKEGTITAPSLAPASEETRYWELIHKEQETQFKAKMDDVEARLERLKEPGSGSNHVERFDFLKSLFEVDLVEAYIRARAAYFGLKSAYGIDVPLPDVRDQGYLNDLVLWARQTTYRLEKYLFQTQECTVAFALHDSDAGTDVPQLMTRAAFIAARTAGTFTFQLVDQHFRRTNLTLRNPRLRGVDVHVYKNDDTRNLRFWRTRAEIPKQSIAPGPGLPAVWSEQPVVYIPLATYPSVLVDSPDVPNERAVYNASPIGEWTIRIEPKNILGGGTDSDEQVSNILLRLRVSYEKG